jgi:hypothetical protein
MVGTIYLVDELANTYFNSSNISSSIIYLDDDTLNYDFKLNNATNISFSSTNHSKLRLELKYADGATVTRYIDIALVSRNTTTQNISLCANKEGTTHYEQIILSTSQKPVALLSNYANCYVVADYTRFAYQDAFALKAYTIERQYGLYTFDSLLNTIFFSSLDGSIQQPFNLDNLEFISTAYSYISKYDSLAISWDRLANGSIIPFHVKIYYKNIRKENINVSFRITRTDTNESLVYLTNFTNPNDFNVYFNYSSYPNINATTRFKVLITKTTLLGTVYVAAYFDSAFNPEAPASKALKPQVAFVISLLLFMFGFSFTVSKTTFSYFGIFILLISLAFLGFTQQTWYTLFLMAMEVIILVFAVIIMSMQNTRTIST